MNRSLIAYYVGSIALLLYGVGHTLGYLQGKGDDKDKEFVRILRATPAEMPGVSKSRFDLYEGYSWMTAAGMLALGLVNLVLVRTAAETSIHNRWLLGVNFLSSAAVTLLTLRYFFLPPLVLAGLATGAFLLGWVWAR